MVYHLTRLHFFQRMGILGVYQNGQSHTFINCTNIKKVYTTWPTEQKKGTVPYDFEKCAMCQVSEQLVQTRRELRKQKQKLAQLKYEWAIAKRRRKQSHSEDEREQWRIQSDVHMGLVLQQENIVKELEEKVSLYQSTRNKIDTDL